MESDPTTPVSPRVLVVAWFCLLVEQEMPGAELELPGPRYEPLSGVQPGSVGELGQSPASITSSVPPVEPASTPSSSSDDSDSDSGSEPDLDDPIDCDFVPETPDPSPSPLPEPDMGFRDFPPSPSASSPEPSSSSSSDLSSDSPEPSPEPGSNAGDPPAPPNCSRDSRTPPAPGGPYVTRSGCNIRPVGEWWKVNHPYHNAREQHRHKCSGRSPECCSGS